MDIARIISDITPFLWLGIATAVILRKRQATIIFCIAWIIIGFIPAGELSVSEILRGVIGDLSLTSLILAIFIVIKYTSCPKKRLAQHHPSFNITLLIITVSSILLYSNYATPWSSFDLYATGYSTYLSVLFILAIALIACIMQNYLLAFTLLAISYCHYFNLLGFGNLWNTALDIWLGIGSFTYSLYWCFSGRKTRSLTQ